MLNCDFVNLPGFDQHTPLDVAQQVMEARHYFEKGVRAAQRYGIPYMIAITASERSADAKTDGERDMRADKSNMIYEQLKIEEPSLLLNKPSTTNADQTDHRPKEPLQTLR